MLDDLYAANLVEFIDKQFLRAWRECSAVFTASRSTWSSGVENNSCSRTISAFSASTMRAAVLVGSGSNSADRYRSRQLVCWVESKAAESVAILLFASWTSLMWTFAHQAGQLVLTAVLLMSKFRMRRAGVWWKAPECANSAMSKGAYSKPCICLGRRKSFTANHRCYALVKYALAYRERFVRFELARSWFQGPRLMQRGQNI